MSWQRKGARATAATVLPLFFENILVSSPELECIDWDQHKFRFKLLYKTLSAIITTNAISSVIRPLGTHFYEIYWQIKQFYSTDSLHSDQQEMPWLLMKILVNTYISHSNAYNTVRHGHHCIHSARSEWLLWRPLVSGRWTAGAD